MLTVDLVAEHVALIRELDAIGAEITAIEHLYGALSDIDEARQRQQRARAAAIVRLLALLLCDTNAHVASSPTVH